MQTKVLAVLSATILLAGLAQAASVIDILQGVSSGDVDEFAISPDGTTIAFVGQLNGDSSDQLYTVPITGGTATLINPAGVGDIDGGVAWTPDGTGIIARYGGGTDNIDNQMYVMPANGSQTATQLTFNNYNVFDQQVSADGSTLFYIDARNDAGGDLDDLLYATSITNPGTGLVELTPDPIAELDTGGYAQVGADIIFAGSLPGEGETRFYRTAADGSGTPAEISVTNFPTLFTGDIDRMSVTPDGQSIIFVGDLTTDGVDELYSMPVAGGVATQLTPAIPSFTDIGNFEISPDGQWIAFTGDYLNDADGEAYLMPIGGGTPIRVSDDLTGLGYNADVVNGVGRLAFTPDSSQLIYIADGRANGVNEMFITNVPEPASLILLSSALLLIRRR
jgi:Tol biopolymer transport system component